MSDSAQPESLVVLIVEDEPDNLDVAQTVLEFNGAKVHTAGDGIQGLAILKEIKPSIILLDLSMPNMDGWEMIKHLRTNPDTKALPVIAVTAHAMAGDEERVAEAGFDGYIAKPFRFHTLMGEINRCINNCLNKGKE